MFVLLVRRDDQQRAGRAVQQAVRNTALRNGTETLAARESRALFGHARGVGARLVVKGGDTGGDHLVRQREPRNNRVTGDPAGGSGVISAGSSRHEPSMLQASRARAPIEWVQLAMSRSERTHASGCPVSARPILTQLADDAPTGVCAGRGSWRPRSRQPPPDGRAVSRDASARTRPHRAVDRVGAPQRRSPTGSNTTDRPAPRRYDSSTGDRGTVWRPCLRRSQPLSFSHLSTPSDVARVSCLARAARLRHKSHSRRAHIPTGPRGLGCSGAQDAHLSPWSCGTGRAMMDP